MGFSAPTAPTAWKRPVARSPAAAAVFLGRFVAFLRAVMSFLAGTSRMRYRRFLAYNAAGGRVWGVGSVLLGYLAGNSYAAIERTFGRAVALLAAAVVLVGIVAGGPAATAERPARSGRIHPRLLTAIRRLRNDPRVPAAPRSQS